MELADYLQKTSSRPRVCIICTLPQRDEIDILLREQRAGATIIHRWLAEDQKIEVSRNQVRRHLEGLHHLEGR